jgi:hypothetical protein
MIRPISALFSLLFITAFQIVQAEQIKPETFIRERGTYVFDDAGSSIEVITAKDNKPSLILDFRIRTKTSSGSNKASFTEEGILRGNGWFVFLESPERIWIFDGKNSLAIAERRFDAKGGEHTSVKDFDAQSAAICPVKVEEALPQAIREALFKKYLF